MKIRKDRSDGFGPVTQLQQATFLETDRLRGELAELKSQIVELKTENGSLSEQMGNLQRQVSITAMDAETARRGVGSAQASDLAVQFERLEQVLQERMNQAIVRLEGELQVERRNTDGLRQELATTKQTFDRLQQEWEAEYSNPSEENQLEGGEKGVTSHLTHALPSPLEPVFPVLPAERAAHVQTKTQEVARVVASLGVSSPKPAALVGVVPTQGISSGNKMAQERSGGLTDTTSLAEQVERLVGEALADSVLTRGGPTLRGVAPDR